MRISLTIFQYHKSYGGSLSQYFNIFSPIEDYSNNISILSVHMNDPCRWTEKHVSHSAQAQNTTALIEIDCCLMKGDEAGKF